MNKDRGSRIHVELHPDMTHQWGAGFMLPYGKQHTYLFTLSDDPDWTGTITQLRLDPVGASNGGAGI